MKVLLFISLMTTAFGALAQDTVPAFGLRKPSEENLKAIPHRAAAAIDEDVKLPPFVDIAHLMPPCGNQGKQGACAAFSAVYDYLSFLEYQKYRKYYLKDGNLDLTTLFSPKFTYNLVILDRKEDDQDCAGGATFKEILTKLKTMGAPTLGDLPYKKDIVTDCLQKPDEKYRSLAMQHRFLTYSPLYSKDIRETQAELAEERPIMLGMDVDSDFYNKGKDAYNKHQLFVYHHNPAKFLAYHALVCVGYNDTTHLLKIMNSWGDKWGTNGFFYITYQDYIVNVRERYIAYVNPTTAIPTDSLNVQTSRVLSFNKRESLKDWFRLGYFKNVNGYKIGVNYINKNKNEVVVSFYDSSVSRFSTNLILKANETKYFYSNGKKINITLNGIDTKGINSMINDVSLSIKLTNNQFDPVVGLLMK